MRENLRASFETRSWSKKDGVPRSGIGSDMPHTEQLRLAFPRILEKYKVKKVFDAPCGDWFWMQHVNLQNIDYIGADISKELITEISEKFTAPNVKFEHLDITSDPIPDCDMMICRDCLFHLKRWLKWQFFENFAKSNAKYLMLTMHHIKENENVGGNGGFKPFNPMMDPFLLPKPLEVICETSDKLPKDPFALRTNGKPHRSIGIWPHKAIADMVARRKSEQN